MKQTYLFALATLLLASCSVLAPVKPEQTANYELTQIPTTTPHKNSHHGKTILVTQPETRPVYNTTQMAYTIRPYQVSYFGKNQWVETPSQMFQPLIIQTLQNTLHYHAVVAPPYIGRYDYILSTQILKLQQNYISSPNVVEFSVRAVLTNVSTNRVVATKQFSVRVPITHNTPYGGVIASNAASVRVLEEIAKFCLQYS